MESSVLSSVEPFWLLVIVASGIYATLLRIFFRRGAGLPLLWLAGAIGFTVGEVLADRFFTLSGLRLGSFHIVESTLADWVLMLVANRVRPW